jgi:hypothetical protein
MNNFKWQYLVGECKMDFPYCHSNPIFWERPIVLPAQQYHYGGRETSPTHTGDLQSMLLYTVLSAGKDLAHAQEPTGNIKSSIKIRWTFGFVSVSIRNWVCKYVDKL